MTDYTQPIPLVISNGVYQNASDVFNVIDPDSGGVDTFSVKLSNDGGTTLTHWAAYTPLAVDVENALRNMTTTQFKAFVDQKATELERTPVGSITAFKGSLQMGQQNQNPWEFINSLSLVAYNEPV